jgi:hypothetical protein
MNGRPRIGAAAGLLLWLSVVSLNAWGPQGHRLVAAIADNHLTPAARESVASLLGPETLADVAVWADEYLVGVNQTSFWHYVNIPPDATAYDRDRDCPRQPGVAAGSRGDVWRDCVVDRIRYNEERLANLRLDRADRAVALKFVVHFIGDLHQPFHATAVERGGNGILVRVFGSEACGGDPARPIRCNLHAVWDTQLIAHRALDDAAYVRRLEAQIAAQHLESTVEGDPAAWAMESLMLSNAAMLPPGGDADESYFSRQIPVIEERLAVGGLRLAAVLNRALAAPAAR